MLKAILKISLCLFCVGWAQHVEGARITVREILFEGASAIDKSVLQKGLLMRRGMPLDSALVVRDMKHIVSHYQALGYWQVRVHFPQVVTQGGQGTLRFRIEEGLRTRVDTVAVLGDDLLKEDDGDAIVRLSRGTVLTPARLDEQLDVILRFYENRGYPFCALTPEVVFDENTARVTIDIDAGPFCVVDTVVFEGNAVTRADVLLREMRFVGGRVYDQRQVDRSVQYLRRLPFLISVADPQVRRQGDVTTLVMQVQEARTARVEGGVGYAPQNGSDGLTGKFALDIHNVAGAGRLGQVAWQRTGVGASDLQVRVQEPWVLNRPLSVDFELEMRQRLGYSEWGLTLGSTIHAWAQGQVWGHIARGQVVPDSVGVGAFEKSDVWTLAVGGRVDYRDHLWNPRRGWMGETTFELGRVIAAGEADVRRLQSVHLQGFYALSARSVLALAGRGLWVSQEGGVPDDARIRVGGATSLRGYREEAFLATEAGWLSLEWRYLVGARSRLFGFIDAGILQDVSGRVWPVGYGVGMVLQSRMGMVGFDVGWAKEDGFGDGKIHVHIVNAF